MTYPNPRRDRVRSVNNDTGMWIAGIVGLCLVLGLVFWAASRSPNTAMTDTRPTATTPAATTGSGASPSTIPNNPNGTIPQKDMTKPAPTPAPAAR